MPYSLNKFSKFSFSLGPHEAPLSFKALQNNWAVMLKGQNCTPVSLKSHFFCLERMDCNIVVPHPIIANIICVTGFFGNLHPAIPVMTAVVLVCYAGWWQAVPMTPVPALFYKKHFQKKLCVNFKSQWICARITSMKN